MTKNTASKIPNTESKDMGHAMTALREARERARTLRHHYVELEAQLNKLHQEQRDVTGDVERCWERVRRIAEGGL
jgi:predicted transcriptional regulator